MTRIDAVDRDRTGTANEQRHTYTVDVIAGDGIGPEVMPAAVACIDALASALGFSATGGTGSGGRTTSAGTAG